MESMFPALTKNPSLGSPKTVMLFASFQSGWAMIPTLKPRLSSRRLMIAWPKDG